MWWKPDRLVIFTLCTSIFFLPPYLIRLFYQGLYFLQAPRLWSSKLLGDQGPAQPLCQIGISSNGCVLSLPLSRLLTNPRRSWAGSGAQHRVLCAAAGRGQEGTVLSRHPAPCPDLAVTPDNGDCKVLNFESKTSWKTWWILRGKWY